MASLRPALVWQRTSPASDSLAGPVLYQLVFRFVAHDNTLVGTGSMAQPLRIASGGVGQIQLATGAVGTSQIADGAVTNAKVADGALSPVKITGTAATLGPNSFIGDQGISGKLRLDGPFSASSAGLFDIDAPFIPGGRLRVALNGNVGIGTASPGQKLTVAGVIQSTSGGVQFPDGSVQSSAAVSVVGGTSPQQIALLKWFPAYQSVSFPATGASAVAFDGVNIWVTNNINPGGTVTKLRASDGASQGTFSVGSSPQGVAFDGANIWVTNYGSDNVSKLRPSDGALLGTFAVGNKPIGVAFDGANIWVANSGTANVSELRASDGMGVNTFVSGGLNPTGVAFDGVNIWVTNYGSGTVSKLRASDGAPQPGSPFTVGTNPSGVAFDGANIWVANNGSSTVSKLRASDGMLLGTFTVGTPYGVAFDGTNIWVTNYGAICGGSFCAGNTVTKLRASDGAPLGTFVVGTAPYGVAFDGVNIWVANSFINTVSKL